MSSFAASKPVVITVAVVVAVVVLGLGLGLGLPAASNGYTPTLRPTAPFNSSASVYSFVPENTARFFTTSVYVGNYFTYELHMDKCRQAAILYNYDPARVFPFACYCSAMRVDGPTCRSYYNLASTDGNRAPNRDWTSMEFQSHNGKLIKAVGRVAFPGFNSPRETGITYNLASPELELLNSTNDHYITGCGTDGRVASAEVTCQDYWMSGNYNALRMERGCAACTDYAWTGGFNDVRISCPSFFQSWQKFMCYVA